MRFLVGVVDAVESTQDILHRVAVEFDDIPSEGAPTLLDGVQRHHILSITADLKVVTVDDSHQVVQMIAMACHGSFVDRAFALFAVAHHDIGAVGFFVHLGSNGHAYTDA